MQPLIIDCFAGGGGASAGIEMALGRYVDIAVNHDPAAIRMHKTNHPHTLHLTEDIFKADLQGYVGGRHVGLMWASPDCTSHSRAKGGRPRNAGLRILPWAVYKHAKVLLPDVIIMENVEEIQQWGPLDSLGHPVKEKKGEEYRKFICRMQGLGYDYGSRVLVAADYGAPTTRKRWYAVFRRDGKPVAWPGPTHNKNGTGGLKKWVGVCSVLDFTDLGKSIFGRKKPLAENTMKRIARGLQKFVFENPEPFIIKAGCSGSPRGMDTGAPGSSVGGPLLAVAPGGHHGIASPYIMQTGQTGFSRDRNRAVWEPLSTVVTKNEHCIAAPLLIQYHSEKRNGEARGQTAAEPLRTIDGSNRYGAVAAFLAGFYRGSLGQQGMPGPVHTITSPGHFGQVSVSVVKLEELLGAGVPEETAQKCTWVSEFIIEYYGQGTGQAVSAPLHTVTTKDRFALLTVLGDKYVVMDIFLRMLTAEELKLAQGFPADYIIDRDCEGNTYPVGERVKRIGNSVVPVMAEALVKANCSHMETGGRTPCANVETEDDGQMCRVI